MSLMVAGRKTKSPCHWCDELIVHHYPTTPNRVVMMQAALGARGGKLMKHFSLRIGQTGPPERQ
jgi:hypothetical protein